MGSGLQAPGLRHGSQAGAQDPKSGAPSLGPARAGRAPRLVTLLGGLAGAALFAYAVERAGTAEIVDGIRRVGWGLVAILVLAAVRFVGAGGMLAAVRAASDPPQAQAGPRRVPCRATPSVM